MNIRNKSEVKIGCIIMASGISRRFGENKLLAEFGGKSFIQIILDLTCKDFSGRDGSDNNVSGIEGINCNPVSVDFFTKRLVLTRTCEVEEVCRKQDVSVIYHELQKRNEAIKLGVEKMQDMDGILFCPCDQPLLDKTSLKRMVDEFEKCCELGENDVILRLGYGEKIGAPILFGKGNFAELQNLPEKCGGSRLCEKYPERVRIIQAGNGLELFDIDTKDDLVYLMKLRE